MNCSIIREKNKNDSCFKKQDLIIIAKKLNECRTKRKKIKYCIGKPIDTNTTTQILYKKIKNILKIKEQDWIKQQFIGNSYIKTDIFKPKGPKLNEWLSNYDISLVMNQYIKFYEKTKKDFVFHGVVMANWFNLHPELLQNFKVSNIKKQAVILNTDSQNGPGKHWVAVFINKREIEFFDSNGSNPNTSISKLLNNLSKLLDIPIKINKIKHQTIDGICGIYTLKFVLYRLFGLKTFKQFIKDIQPDSNVNQLRKTFFLQN